MTEDQVSTLCPIEETGRVFYIRLGNSGGVYPLFFYPEGDDRLPKLMEEKYKHFFAKGFKIKPYSKEGDGNKEVTKFALDAFRGCEFFSGYKTFEKVCETLANMKVPK